MKGKITQKLIDGLKPQAMPFEFRDTGLKGFLLRVQPSGARSISASAFITANRSALP